MRTALLSIAAVIVLACSEKPTGPPTPPPDAAPTSPPDAGPVPPPDTGPPPPPDAAMDPPRDAATAPPRDAATAPPPNACGRPLPLPLTPVHVPGPPASEDFTFDGDGYMIALEGGHSLVRLARGAPRTLIEPNVVVGGRGLRVLPSGDIVIADRDRSLLVRVDRQGNIRRLTTTIPAPNGVEIGPNAQLYVTDFGVSGEVYRVDPESGAAVSVARPGHASNGITFDRARTTLYVGDHDAGVLFRMRVLPDGAVDSPQPFAKGLGKPDGLTADECGNIYAASWDSKLYRVAPDGTVQVAAVFPLPVSAVSFGSGRHGWDRQNLYVMAVALGGVYELKPGPAP